MFLNRRFYLITICIICCFLAGYVSTLLFTAAQILFGLLMIACIYEYFRLFRSNATVRCTRECADRFSNGDDNPVKLHLENTYSFPVSLQIIDEIPAIFQNRDILFQMKMEKEESKLLTYTLRPVKRGVYEFGKVNVLVTSGLGLISRKIVTGAPCQVAVYPAYQCLRKYELIAISNKLTDAGQKRIRKIGQQLEPEQIRDYVKGDDYRTINWKATARRSKLMVNVFQEERAQNIYCLIDKGRPMQSAFERMTLLDYAINASLALSYVSMIKGDKVGLLTFEKQQETLIPASRQSGQMQRILETLYGQNSTFSESNFSTLYQSVTKHIKTRSLLIIYTNFDTVPAMQRQLTFLSMLAKRHTVIVVFFENTELHDLTNRQPATKTEAYQQVIAEKMEYEKSLIVSKLRKHNMIAILTHPSQLTMNVINKYLEIKAQGLN